MKDKLVDHIILDAIGTETILYIRRRTIHKGKFLPGSSPDAENYSTKPFAMPIGALNKTFGSRLKKTSKNDKKNFQVFTAKSGNLWVLVKGGYKKVREISGKKTDKVEMSWSGSYLRDLGIVENKDHYTTLGWTSSENQQLAYWHEIMGAGKSKRKHKILGLLNKEQKELTNFAGKKIFQKFKKSIEIPKAE